MTRGRPAAPGGETPDLPGLGIINGRGTPAGAAALAGQLAGRLLVAPRSGAPDDDCRRSVRSA